MYNNFTWIFAFKMVINMIYDAKIKLEKKIVRGYNFLIVIFMFFVANKRVLLNF